MHDACMSACLHACVYACMYACMSVCMYAYVHADLIASRLGDAQGLQALQVSGMYACMCTCMPRLGDAQGLQALQVSCTRGRQPMCHGRTHEPNTWYAYICIGLSIQVVCIYTPGMHI